MKRILMGALITSSLAMSGNIKDCSYNMEQQKKNLDLSFELAEKALNLTPNSQIAEFAKKESKLYRKLYQMLLVQAEVDCKGVLYGENYTYATTGHF